MKLRVVVPILVSASLLASATIADAASIELAGDNGTGFLSMSNVKSWLAEPDPVTESEFPYFFDSDAGLWRSIAAVPLSADSTYAEEALGFTVLNKSITQSDFGTFSAGTIDYSDALVTGSGIESVDASALTLAFNNAGFSPLYSAYNTGDNFGWAYSISASNVNGAGLTFVNGVLTSIDLTADISVAVSWLDLPAGTWASTYAGSLTISGDMYAFQLDVMQDNETPFFGSLPNTHMVFNRAGDIAAVVPIPEPQTYLMLGIGLMLIGGAVRARRSGR